MTASAAEQLAQFDAIIAEHRALLAANPDNLYPAFADALMGRAAVLAEEGRPEEALDAATEGVDHYRHLLAVEPATFGAYTASAMNNLSNRLSEVGREDEAYGVGEEAISLARDAMTGNNATDARFVLVSSLMNQSGRSWRSGDTARAIDQMGAAVAAFREGGEGLNQFLGVMVDALHRNALALAEADRWEEAVAIRRMTAQVFPDVIPAPVDHLLALTLEQAAFAKSRAGKPGEALPLVEEAVQIARALAANDAEQYGLFLGQSLSNMASRQLEAGAAPQALESALEAINLFQTSAQTDAGNTVIPLAMTLETFASILMTLGHEEQAQHVLAQRDELMEIVRQVENLDGHEHGDGCGCHH